jgi:hypothetical protein
VDQVEHYESAERYLLDAGRAARNSDSMQSSERIVALVKLAEAHMKMIPFAPMAMPSRPL